MKLSIIVNYKTPRLLLNCLASIVQFGVQDTEIIVVDNFSQDDTESLLRQHFQACISCKWAIMPVLPGPIMPEYNWQGEALLLLNSDTIVQKNAINRCLVQFLSSDYVACGVQLLNADGTPQISGNYAMTGGLNYLLPLPYLGSFLKGIANILQIKKPNVPNATGLIEVDWINGAFLMARKAP